MKKLLSLLLCLPLMLTLPSAVSAKNADVQTAYTVFRNLGVIDESFDMQAEVTRAGFTDLVIRAGAQEQQAGGDLPFSDVKDHKYYDSISAAYNLGIISEDTEFNPDNIITVEEAVSIICRFLGYKFIVQKNGGWSVGYMQTGYNYNILEGTGVAAGSDTVNGTAAVKMLMNMYEAPVVKMYTETDFELSDDSYMNEYRDIYKASGVVTSDGMIDLYGSLPMQNSVNIDNEPYAYFGDTDGLIGRRVTYYYCEHDMNSRELLAYKTDDRGSVYNIDAYDISSKTTASQIVFEDKNGKEKTLRISADVKLMYNAVSKFEYTAEDLKPYIGEVTVIDNDGDAAADVIIVYSYRIAVAAAADADREQIALKFGMGMLDPDGEYTLIKDGRRVGISDIKEWDVLNIAENDGIMTIVISEESASGIVTAITADDDGDVYVIDGEEYKRSRGFINLSPDIKVGTRGVFYMDAGGRIVCADMSTTQRSNYSLLAGAIYDEVEDIAYFSLFNRNNMFDRFECREGLVINEKRYEPKQAAEYLYRFISKPVIAKTNADGTLREIQTAEDRSADEDYSGYDEDSFTCDKFLTDVSFFYSWGAGCYCPPETVVYIVPQDITRTDLYTATTFDKRVGRSNTGANESNVSFYDLDKFNRPGVITIEGVSDADKDEVDVYNEFFVVSKNILAVDDDGLARRKICGYYDGEYREYWAEKNAHNVTAAFTPESTERMGNFNGTKDRTRWGFIGHTADMIGTGDVLQPGFNTKNEIVCYRMLWSSRLMGTDIRFSYDGEYGGDDLIYVTPGDYYELSENDNLTRDEPGASMLYTAYGEILEVSGTNFRYVTNYITRNSEGTATRQIRVERAQQALDKVYILENKIVREGSAADMKIGDKIFVHTRDMRCMYMLIIKK